MIKLVYVLIVPGWNFEIVREEILRPRPRVSTWGGDDGFVTCPDGTVRMKMGAQP